MNRPKLRKKELAARADKLEAQLDHFKNRLNRYSYKKTKQSNRLELLREHNQVLNRRLDRLDRQLTLFALDDDNPPAQWLKLQEQVRTLKQAVEVLQTRGLVEPGALTADMQELQQLRADLELMRKVTKRVSDSSDELQRDSNELSKHVRNLEDSSSKFSMHHAAHDDRIRDLEEAFAESGRQQENRQQGGKEQEETEFNGVRKNLESLQVELALLRGQFSDDHGQQKDLDRKIELLSNRIGEVNGQFTTLYSDLEHRLQSSKLQVEGTEQRLPEMKSQLESLKTAQQQDIGIIDALELNQEKSLQLGENVTKTQQALSEHLERVEQHLERIQTEEVQAGARIQALETRFQELRTDTVDECSQVDELEQELGRFRTEISRLQEEWEQTSLQQQQLEQQISSLGADSEQREQQLAALTEAAQAQSKRLDVLDTAIETSGKRTHAQEQRIGEWMARLDTTQSAVAKQLDTVETVTTGHDDSVAELQAGLKQANAASNRQQQQIEAVRSNGFRHTMAITALLIIGLLGGLALYQSLTQDISGIKREVALSLTRQSEQYAPRQETAARQQRLDAALTETRKQLAALSAGSTAPVLQESLGRSGEVSPAGTVSRRAQLEQHHARNEEQTGNLSVAHIEREIAALETRVEHLQSLAQPDAELMQRIATLELSLPQVQKALEQRLQQVEKGQELGLEQQQRLHGRIDTLTRTVAVLKQDARLSNFPQQEVRWQRMAEIGQYSIQLLGMHELKALLAYAKRYPLDGERTYARTTYQGRDWYILLYGTFPGVQDARAALDALPDPIREHQPWIRELPVGPSFTAIP